MRLFYIAGLFILTTGICLLASLVALRVVIDASHSTQLASMTSMATASADNLVLAVSQLTQSADLVAGLVQGTFPVVPVGSAALDGPSVAADVVDSAFFYIAQSQSAISGIGLAPDGVWAYVVQAGTSNPPFPNLTDASLQIIAGFERSVVVLFYPPFVDVMQPVFNTSYSTTQPRTMANLWGLVAVRFSIDPLASSKLGVLQDNNYRYTLTAQYFASDETVILAQSPMVPPSPPDLELPVPCVNVITANGTNASWKLSVWYGAPLVQFTGNSDVGVAVVSSFAFGIVVVIVALVTDALCCCGTHPSHLERGREVRGSREIPTAPPFYLLAIEMCKAARVWEVAPQAASDMIVRVTEAVSRLMLGKCHLVHALGDGMMVVSSTVEDALDFADDLLCWSRTQSWPPTAQILLGETDIPFRLRIAIHRCVEAEAVRDDHDGLVSYSGPDVDQCQQLRCIAPGGFITVTPQLYEAALDDGIAEECFRFLGSSVPTPDGISFEALVFDCGDTTRERSGSLSLDASDVELWSRHELVGDTVSLSRSRRGQHGSHSPPTPQHSQGPELTAASELTDIRQVSVSRRRNSSLGKNALIDHVLNHPAFLRFDSVSWLPAQACAEADAKKLRYFLQEYVTSQEEASSFELLLTLATYYFCAYTFILRPLAAAEQRNIIRRWQMTFGIPDRGFVHRLAVQCAVIGFRALPSRVGTLPPPVDRSTWNSFRIPRLSSEVFAVLPASS